MPSILKCPVCDAPLTLGPASAACEARHSFDRARSGYLNLLLPDKRRSDEPGDSPLMMRSRRAFLQAGFYDPIARATEAAVSRMLSGRDRAAIADLGCGEGFFLHHLKRALTIAPAAPFDWYGCDISRTGIKMATTYDRTVTWIVASVHNCPFLADSLDIALSMCAPMAAAEFRRVLRNDGALVTMTPGDDHLDALRAIIYPSVVPHAATPAPEATAAGFALTESTRVRYPIALASQEAIQDLLAMTPYYWNINLETKARVKACSRMDVTVDAQIHVFRPQ